MVEMNVVQIGLNWGWIEVECGDESDCGSGECGIECGDGDAKETSPTAILPNNQSKPIVPLFSFSPITFSYNLITFSYNL